MRISRSPVCVLGALAGAALLAACSGGRTSTGAYPNPMDNSRMGAHQPFRLNERFSSFTGVKPPVMRQDHRKSWISPDVKRARHMLFETDYGSGVVDMYTVPNMALKGQITGLDGPQGACSDSSGNVWVTNTNTRQVFQYSRTGTLLKTINDSYGYPTGCAVNNSNGNVAIANIVNNTYYDGGVVIYPNGSGSGTEINNPGQDEYFFDAYDTSGNLYVDGTHNYDFVLSECRSGSSSCHTLKVSSASVGFPGGVSWNKVTSQLVVVDQKCGGNLESCAYAGAVSGNTYKVTSTTALSNYDGTACDVDQPTLAPSAKYVAGGCFSFGSTSITSTVDRWAFPAGGTPTNYAAGTVEPVGAAISNK